MGVTAAQLAAFQAAANRSMDLSVAIYRATLTQDGEGNVSKSFTLHATVNGNLAQPTVGQLQNYGYAIADVATWVVRLPVGTDILLGDRLTVNGQNLEVQVVLTPQSYSTSTRVLAAEVKRS